MKLLYSQGTCAFSVHVLLEELGVKYQAEAVSIDKKGPELLNFNPFGYVPVLIKDSGEVMTEAIAILQYVANMYPEKKLLPAAGTEDWAHCIQWLSYTSSEIHQKVGPLFHKEGLTPEFLKEVQKKAEGRVAYVDSYMMNKKFLVGEEFSVADMYMLAILRIATHVGIKLEKFAALTRYLEMMNKMPSVKRADEMVKKDAGVKKSA